MAKKKTKKRSEPPPVDDTLECTENAAHRCQTARETVCKCACGGANHGTQKQLFSSNKKETMKQREFYDEKTTIGKKRKRSGEVDYGVWWYDGRNRYPTYRISWVADTGEFYAAAADGANDEREIEILGEVQGREEAERALEGWVDKCGEMNSLQWAREQLAR